MTDINDYLSAVRANNPGLLKHWPGAVSGNPADPRPQPAPTKDVSKMSDIDLAFEYRECKESGECGPRLTELERETTQRISSKEPPKAENVATSIKRGCLPCAMGHLTACSGLLNEAMRFVRTEGVGSDQVLDDTNGCLMELNALERVDMSPEKISQLPPWEKELALEVLSLSKETRHALEAMRTPDDLEKIAANLQPRQREILKKWFRHKIGSMTPQDQRKIVEEALAKVKKEGENA